MKRIWTDDELIEHWTLRPDDLTLVNQARTAKNRLGLALLLKWFQYEGRFPRRKQDIPATVVTYLARQLAVSPDAFREYPWQGRTIARHHTAIRHHLVQFHRSFLGYESEVKPIIV